MNEHREFFTVQVSGALRLTDRTLFTPVKDEGAEKFRYYHDTFLALGRNPIEIDLTIFFSGACRAGGSDSPLVGVRRVIVSAHTLFESEGLVDAGEHVGSSRWLSS